MRDRERSVVTSDLLRHRRRMRMCDAVLGVCAVVTAVFRFHALRAGAAPPTVDAGNWLSLGNAWLGLQSRTGPNYPPFVPLAVASTSSLFGVRTAVALCGAVASTLPGLGSYVVLRRISSGLGAVLLGVLLLGANSVGEAAAWGGFPQLVALGALPVFLWQLDTALLTRARRATANASAALLLVLLTSHLIAAVALGATGVLIALHALRSGAIGRFLHERLAQLSCLVAVCVVCLPLYLPLLGSIDADAPLTPRAAQLSLGTVLGHLDFLFGDPLLLWRPIVVATVLTPLALYRRRAELSWRLTTSAIGAIIAVALVTRSSRALAFLPQTVAFAVATWLPGVRAAVDQLSISTRRLVIACGVGVTALVATVGLARFDQQLDSYRVMSPDAYRAITWYRDHVDDAGGLAVSSPGPTPLGWWVEGLTRQPAYYTSAPKYLLFDDERRRARVADRIFSPQFPDDASISFARAKGVRHLLVVSRHAPALDARAEQQLAEQGAVVVYRRPGATVIRL